MKIKQTEIKIIREQLIATQNGLCAICKQPFGLMPLDPVLDHNHATGAIRGVLHRCCNSVLGKLENGAKRYGLRDIISFISGTASYLLTHRNNMTGLIHPSHNKLKRKRKSKKLKLLSKITITS